MFVSIFNFSDIFFLYDFQHISIIAVIVFDATITCVISILVMLVSKSKQSEQKGLYTYLML